MEEELLRLARAAPTRGIVERIAARPGSEDLPARAEEALGAGEVRAALNLALAGVVAGSPPSADLAVRLLPIIEDTQIAIRLLGSVRGEGLLDALLVSAASGRHTPDRQGLVLFLAATLARGREPPDELLRRIRHTARHELDGGGADLVGLAALEVDDPDVREVARSYVRLVDKPRGRKRRDDLLARFESPLLEALPEEAPVEKFAGFTIRKAAASAGRNDPCPCGSGKKHKKCCLGKEERREETPDPGVPLGGRGRLHRSMSDAQFKTLHPEELLRITPEELSASRLLHAVEVLSHYRAFPAAERRMEALLERDDLPEGTTPDSVRSGMLVHAITARDRHAVDRILASVEAPEKLSMAADLGLAILAERPDSLALAEELATKGLREPEGKDFRKLCAALLFFTPALGILVARGALEAYPPSEVERLLETVELARDTLLLPPDDPAWDIHDLLSARHVEEQLEASAVERSEKLAAEAQELRGAAAAARARELSARRDLERLELRLEKAQQVAEESREAAEEALRAAGPSPETVAKLRRKVGEYRDLIEEGNEERRKLRRRLSGFRSRVDEVAAEEPEPEPDDEADGLEEDEEPGPERRHVRFPIFSREFREATGGVPEHVARDALTTAGALAGGGPGAWTSVKRIKAHGDLRSARIGRHRMLFRLEGEDGIEFLRLINRRDLEVTLRRMG